MPSRVLGVRRVIARPEATTVSRELRCHVMVMSQGRIHYDETTAEHPPRVLVYLRAWLSSVSGSIS